MRLQTLHEARIAPPMITLKHNQTTVGNQPQPLPQSQAKHETAARKQHTQLPHPPQQHTNKQHKNPEKNAPKKQSHHA